MATHETLLTLTAERKPPPRIVGDLQKVDMVRKLIPPGSVYKGIRSLDTKTLMPVRSVFNASEVFTIMDLCCFKFMVICSYSKKVTHFPSNILYSISVLKLPFHVCNVLAYALS
jgi:hypothetical protein